MKELPSFILAFSIFKSPLPQIIIGLTQAYVGYYQFDIESAYNIRLGNGFSIVAPYLIMFVILLIKPHGLFGTEEVERVWAIDQIYILHIEKNLQYFPIIPKNFGL